MIVKKKKIKLEDTMPFLFPTICSTSGGVAPPRPGSRVWSVTTVGGILTVAACKKNVCTVLGMHSREPQIMKLELNHSTTMCLTTHSTPLCALCVRVILANDAVKVLMVGCRTSMLWPRHLARSSDISCAAVADEVGGSFVWRCVWAMLTKQWGFV